MSRMSINLRRSVAVSAIAGVMLAACTPLATAPIAPAAAKATPASQLALHDAMRKLWEDHVTWTRLYIVSAVANLPDSDATAQRLLQNQVDIGNAIKPFYGEEAGNKLTALLRDHILEAAELLKVAKSGNASAVDAAKVKWYANADDIAQFLSNANPKNWPLTDMKAGMKMHLDHTLAEATARLKGDTAADIAAYDAVRVHILGLADLLSTGIINQFPDRFK